VASALICGGGLTDSRVLPGAKNRAGGSRVNGRIPSDSSITRFAPVCQPYEVCDVDNGPYVLNWLF
jgi:hypothetical protein